MTRWVLTLLPLLTAACGVKPGLDAWRLTSVPNGQLLIPPGTASPNAERFSFKADIGTGNSSCTLAPGIEIKKLRGLSIRVAVTRTALAGKPRGWLRSWAGELEAQGCIASGTASILAVLVTEALPLDPAAAFNLLYTDDRISGSVDIGAGDRLQLINPILAPGADRSAPLIGPEKVTGSGGQLTIETKASPDLLGYETTWYTIAQGSLGRGLEIRPISSERHLGDRVETSPTPLTEYLNFAPNASLYRLVYKAVSGEQTVSELLVAGSSTADLERNTHAAETGTCANIPPRMCVLIPKHAAANPFIVVKVNNREITLPPGSSLRNAILSAGEKDAAQVLPNLSVSKNFHGKSAPVEFDRQRPDVLSMRLLGGESVSWR